MSIVQNTGIKPDSLYSFTVSRAVLTAIHLFQSPDETRRALFATKFEISAALSGRTNLVLVGTDGRRLGVYEAEIFEDSLLSGELPKSAEFSIDLTGVRKLPKVRGVDGSLVSVAVFEKHVEISCGKYTYRAPMNEEKFPNWRQVLPVGDVEPTKAIAINWKFLTSFGAAAKLLTDGRSDTLKLGFRGAESAVEVRVPSDRGFTGILMPVRIDEDKPSDSEIKKDEASDVNEEQKTEAAL